MTTTTTPTGTRPPHAGEPAPSLRDNQAFIDHVGTGWESLEIRPDLQPGTAEAAAAHRARLSAALPGRTLVVASGTAPVRNDDNDYLLRADSAFVWATGCQAEDAVLVMTPSSDGTGHDAVIYMPPPFRPGEAGFFGSASHGELWVGPVPGLAEWQQALDVPVRPRGDLKADATRGEALRGGLAACSLRADEARDLGLEPSAELDRVLSTLRAVKDAWEIGQMRQAVDLTVGGFEAVVSEIPHAIRDGLGERWLQGTFDRHGRTFGNGVGYSTIVGSGPHAPVLHWVRCDGPVLPDASILLDMGVEAKSLYTADVTRTIPASGTFTAAERAVHDLVEKSHRAGLAQVRPGVNYLEFHYAAMEVIAQGLSDWGILPVSVDEALSPQGQQHRRWLVCGIGHHLGLDVHDCSKAAGADYQGADLEPGVVMTVEPGLYFHRNDLTVPPELRGIGVRLEDDVLVTETGSDVLSDALPISTDGVEAWTKQHLGAV
jgi:Xaa-Pro aminopeptidase